MKNNLKILRRSVFPQDDSLELIPAILVHDEETFLDRLKLVERDFSVIQIDVMDGSFVPNRSWFDHDVLRDLKTPAKFELHLMAHDPNFYIEETRKIDSVARYIWHIEAKINHFTLLNRCRDLKKEAGLAISPKTPLSDLDQYANLLDEVLVMGAEPGFSGQKLHPQNVDRAREIHKKWPKIPIGFDINVSEDTIPILKDAGVSRFCAASAIFDAEDPLAEAKRLKNLLLN